MLLDNFTDIGDDIEFIDKVFCVNADTRDDIESNLNNLFIKYEKYICDLLDKYFAGYNIQTISHEMVQNLILVGLLNEHNIKLNDKQKQDNEKFLDLLKRILDVLKSKANLISQINNLEVYVDSSIINILKLDGTVEELTDIILNNKKVFDKKTGVYITEEIIEESCTEVEKVEVQKSEVVKVETKKKKKRKQKPAFVLLVFEETKELQDCVKDEFNVDVPDDLYGKDLYEIGIMVNLLRMRIFKGIKNESCFIEQILKYSNMDIIKEISKLLETTCFTSNDLLEFKGIFFDSDCKDVEGDFEGIYEALKLADSCPFLTIKEIKLTVPKMPKRKIDTTIVNTIILICYKMFIYNDLSILTHKISMEYLDQIIECGLANIFRDNPGLSFKYYQMPSVADASSRILDCTLRTSYYQMINGHINKEFLSDAVNSIKDSVCDGKPSLVLQADSGRFMNFIMSKNEILKRQKNINCVSKDNIFKVLIGKYLISDLYLDYLENNYKSDDNLSYKIPVSFGACDYALISRNKMIRLINAHVLESHTITPDIIKECMLFNMITTDDFLAELDNEINNIFSSIGSKQKKIEKSIE